MSAAAPVVETIDLRPVPPAFGATLTGTGRMVRFMLRRDRVRLLMWTGIFVVLYAASLSPGGEYEVLVDDVAAREARALLLSSPVMVALGGPGYGIDDYTMGAAVANELILWIVLTLAVMSILQVVRHTRSEEESGRSELVRAGVVGRHAPTVAAMIVVTIWNGVIAVTSGAVLAGMGLDAQDSFVMTSGMALGALVFAAVALVAAQAMESGSGAIGVGFAVLGIAYFVRTLGDLQEQHGSALSWFSPIAWVQQTRVFVDTRLWPLALCVVAAVLLLLVAGFLGSRRDFGAGLVAVRPGRADAAKSLRGPVSLAWVRQRAGMLWTAFGLAVFWLATGFILPEVPNMTSALGDNPIYAEMLAGNETEMIRSFAGLIGLYAASGAAAFAIVMGLRVKADEEAARAELALAKPLSRARWLGANTLVTLLGAFFVVVLGILAMAVGAAAAGLDAVEFGDFMVLAGAYLPPVAVFVALTVAVYAWVPRATGALWAVFGWVMVVGILAQALSLPEWAQQLSPFWWVSNALADGLEWDRLGALSGIAAVLFLLAFAGFRRRDVPSV
jgi:ABC-2 type transport system permease protein